ncbi:ESCRT-0 subunit protein [Saccharomycopsis crataegensis]|uniref:Vacuolar protein sorting-associated protein 27 n=1 Tax=Saccharomycopsis crataegensis TaxID=43959 RepID=A0AAV5QPT0_9ASCO|nr:ESCRT-0 subunit protein [Saccharomycopsis crataegensis]
MSWFGSSAIDIDLMIKETCSEAIPDGEIDLIKGFEIIDLLKIKKVKAKEFLRAWENRIINNRNPNSQIKLLNLVDLCIKNAGINFSLEIFAGGSTSGSENDFASSYGTIHNQFLNKLLFILHNSKTSDLVKDKVLELIEVWHALFSQNSNLNHNIKSIYKTLRDENFKFPEISEKIILNEKFLESKVPPAWVDSDSCMIGFEPFTMLNRKHHCRNCGGVFCHDHSSNTTEIPMIGLNEPVRVCDSCYQQLTSKPTSKTHSKHHHKHRSSRNTFIEDEEDEMLKKALALSLQESQAPNQPKYSGEQNVSASGKTVDDEDENVEENYSDEDMKAAIAASLRDMEEQKQPHRIDNKLYADSNRQEPPQPYQQPSIYEPILNRELESRVSSKEEESISLFSQLMGNLKQKQMIDSNDNQVLQNEELQSLYTEIIKLKTKLGRNINEDLGKYDQFIDLQAKMNTIVRLYDGLLEKRLKLRGYSRESYSVPSYPEQYPSNIPALSNNYTGMVQQPIYTGSPAIVETGATQEIPNNYTGMVQQPMYTGTQPIFERGSIPQISNQITPQPTQTHTPFVHNPYMEYQTPSPAQYAVPSEPSYPPEPQTEMIQEAPVDVAQAQETAEPSQPIEVPQYPSYPPEVQQEMTQEAPLDASQTQETVEASQPVELPQYPTNPPEIQNLAQYPSQSAQPVQPAQSVQPTQPVQPVQQAQLTKVPTPSEQHRALDYNNYSNMFPSAPTDNIEPPQSQLQQNTAPREEALLIEL